MKPLFFLILISLLYSIKSFSQWVNVIENIDTTGTIRLTNSSWNNTLIKNCTIHNTGNGNDGIFLRDVTNVRIENCTIYNIDGQAGIRFSISGNGTENIQIINNSLFNLKENGINAPQRSQNSPSLNQSNLTIEGNTIFNTGLGSSNGLHHSIYCQASDFKILNNTIFGIRDGNGISVRSSGTISGNIISGESKANKPAIRYYSDHFTGNSDTLLIQNNILFNDSSNAHTLDIFDFANLYQNSSSSNNHIVKNFNIRFNTIISFHPNKYSLKISEDYNSNDYSLTTEGNLLIHTSSTSSCLSTPSNSNDSYNLLKQSISNFNSNTPTYNFHLAQNNDAINYVGSNSLNYPLFDIDGELRSGLIDAGADQYYGSTDIFTLKKHPNFNLYPNPVSKNNKLIIEGSDLIKEIYVYNSLGKQVSKINLENKVQKLNLNISNYKRGIYFIRVNDTKTLTFMIN